MENENEAKVNGAAEEQKAEPKTYTQDEVDSLLQQEADRRVTNAIKKVEAKYEAKMKESEKLARMNEQEKYNYQLEQREKELAEREQALNLAENKAEAIKVLADRGLSVNLVDFVVAENAEDMKANIDILDKAFKASVKAEVEKRLSSSTPKQNFIDSDSMTRDKFNKLPLFEQQKLLNNNPDLMNLFK